MTSMKESARQMQSAKYFEYTSLKFSISFVYSGKVNLIVEFNFTYFHKPVRLNFFLFSFRETLSVEH